MEIPPLRVPHKHPPKFGLVEFPSSLSFILFCCRFALPHNIASWRLKYAACGLKWRQACNNHLRIFNKSNKFKWLISTTKIPVFFLVYKLSFCFALLTIFLTKLNFDWPHKVVANIFQTLIGFSDICGVFSKVVGLLRKNICNPSKFIRLFIQRNRLHKNFFFWKSRFLDILYRKKCQLFTTGSVGNFSKKIRKVLNKKIYFVHRFRVFLIIKYVFVQNETFSWHYTYMNYKTILEHIFLRSESFL